MTDDLIPEPDQLDGAPHPRETAKVIGQDAAQAAFLEAFGSGRMHSGWLLTGPKGVGKATLAWKIATFLLADQCPGLLGQTTLDVPADDPDARLVASGAHPRLKLIRRPWDDKTKRLKTEITVEVVRELKRFFGLSAADGGQRVVIVDAADELNPNAANAILKELEEPPKNTTLLLIAHQPSRLLPTIRSRCRELRCAPLGAHDLQATLLQAGITVDAPESMTALAAGSVGDAVRLIQQDGLTLYQELIKLFAGLPSVDRPMALKLAESCAGRGADTRFLLTLDLIDLFIARVARAGLLGAPDVQGASGEARLLAQLAPDQRAAQRWAELQQRLSDRSRHGRAVNLDPASLILDMVFKIEETAQGVAAA